jgi:hypothetical protein
MAPIPGNNAVLGIAQQGAKGTPNTSPDFVLGYTGTPSLEAQPVLVTLEETDASAQAGIDVVVGTEPGGNTEHYLRPSSFATIAEAFMGQSAGGVATPALEQPYFTLIEDHAAGTFVKQINDAKLGELVVTAQNRQVITWTGTWTGLSYELGGATIGAITETETPLAWPQVQVVRADLHPGTCNSITLTMNRNITRVPGDQGYANIDAVAGLFNVTGEMVVLFEDDGDARAFATGSPTGTIATSTLYTEKLQLIVQFEDLSGVEFAMQEIQFTNVVIGTNTNAEPAYATISFKTVRQADIADNLTIIST